MQASPNQIVGILDIDEDRVNNIVLVYHLQGVVCIVVLFGSVPTCDVVTKDVHI